MEKVAHRAEESELEARLLIVAVCVGHAHSEASFDAHLPKFGHKIVAVPLYLLAVLAPVTRNQFKLGSRHNLPVEVPFFSKGREQSRTWCRLGWLIVHVTLILLVFTSLGGSLRNSCGVRRGGYGSSLIISVSRNFENRSLAFLLRFKYLY